MPGIVGYLGGHPHTDGRSLLDRMARALEPESIHKVWSFADGRLGVARVSLGIVNQEAQPCWDDEGAIGVVMEGELYGAAPLRSQYESGGRHFRTSSDAELILRLYKDIGVSFPVRLNGAFVIAIVDRPAGKIVLVNDRLGLYPLYYGRGDGTFLFGSGVRALLAYPGLPRPVDRTAIAQFLTFDHVLGDRTLLQSVKLMPQGSVMTVSADGVKVAPYSSLRYPKLYPLREEEEYIEELNRLMRVAVRRQAEDGHSKGVMLSGGLDSRWIAALMDQECGSSPFHTFTWGLAGCDDARYAREVAAQTQARHHFFPLKPDFLLHTAERAVRITDGMGNIVNLHALAALDDEVKFARVLYKGFLGDAMLGFALRHQHWAEYDDDTAIRAHMRVHRDQGTLVISPDEHDRLFAADFLGQVGSSVLEAYRRGMLDSGSRMLADQRLYFDLTQRVPRMTLCGVEVVRSRAVVRLPFTDNDLLDFSIGIPPGLRHERRLAQHSFQRAFPKLARIPISWTGLPMQANAREISMRAARLLQWHLHSLGLSRRSDLMWRPYKDYHNWFRGILRPWVESLLLSDRFLQRGYYQPDAVRSLVGRHMAGDNRTVTMGAMIAIEIWHRLFLD